MSAFAHREHALNTWDNFKGALVGLAADRFIQYAGEIIPGFMDQFHRAERRATSNGGGESSLDPVA